jgi:predicted transcriptional regulator
VARTSWFDDSDLPIIDEQVQKLESFTQAMSDGVVEKRELEQQQNSLITAMKAVESGLDDAQHAKVTRLLAELSAYNVMRLLHELQTLRVQKTFGG